MQNEPLPAKRGNRQGNNRPGARRYAAREDSDGDKCNVMVVGEQFSKAIGLVCVHIDV